MSEAIMLQYQAIASYKATSHAELGIAEGEIINVLKSNDHEWWYGQIGENDGWFPASFVIPLHRFNQGSAHIDVTPEKDTSSASNDDVHIYAEYKVHHDGDENNSISSLCDAQTSPKASNDIAIGSFGSTKGLTELPIDLKEGEFRVRALASYRATTSKELSILKGETFVVLRNDDVEWWFGQKGAIGGWFPANYVVAVDTASVSHSDASNDESSKNIVPITVETTTRSPPIDSADLNLGVILADYVALTPKELDLEKGEVVEVLRMDNSDWWLGRRKDGNVGWFPSSFLRLGVANENLSENELLLLSTDSEDEIIKNAVSVDGVLAGSAGEHTDLNIDKDWDSFYENDGSLKHQQPIPKLVRGTATYHASNSNEMDVMPEDIILVLEEENPHWWRGRRIVCGSEIDTNVSTVDNYAVIGLFPTNYAKSINENDPIFDTCTLSLCDDVASNCERSTCFPRKWALIGCDLPEHWEDSIDGGTLFRMTKCERKQRKAVFNLVISESDYVRDIGVMVDVFAKSMVQERIIVGSVRQLFSNADALRRCNACLLQTVLSGVPGLRSKGVNGVSAISISHLARAYLDFATPKTLADYRTYCTRYAMALEYFERLEGDSRFCRFVNRTEESATACGLELQSLLVRPLQYLCSLSFLLQELLSCLSPKENADEIGELSRDLGGICTELCSLVEGMADECPASVHARRVAEIQSRLIVPRRTALQVLSSSRYVVLEADLKELVGITHNDDREISNCHAILFNDLLLLTQVVFDPQGNQYTGYRVRVVIPLDSAAVCTFAPESVAFGVVDRARGRENADTYVLITSNEREQELWVDNLSRGMEDVPFIRDELSSSCYPSNCSNINFSSMSLSGKSSGGDDSIVDATSAENSVAIIVHEENDDSDNDIRGDVSMVSSGSFHRGMSRQSISYNISKSSSISSESVVVNDVSLFDRGTIATSRSNGSGQNDNEIITSPGVALAIDIAVNNTSTVNTNATNEYMEPTRYERTRTLSRRTLRYARSIKAPRNKHQGNLLNFLVQCAAYRRKRVENLSSVDGWTDGFSEEFRVLEKKSAQQQQSQACEAGSRPINFSKNRYRDILPYDKSRVILPPSFVATTDVAIGASCEDSTVTDIPNDDYINASYVSDLNGSRRYIISQGPLEHTIGDFWRMVWADSVTMIVMVTNTVECIRSKCAQYWPDGGSTMRVGGFVVSLDEEDRLDTYVVRRISISRGNSEETRQVWHVQFLAWPDHGAPDLDGAETVGFLELLNTVRRIQPRDKTPLLCHCSAGCGRSGTFVLLDMLLRHMRVAGTHAQIDIPLVVLRLRQERMHCVQTKAQYRFAYMLLERAARAIVDTASRQHAAEYERDDCNTTRQNSNHVGVHRRADTLPHMFKTEISSYASSKCSKTANISEVRYSLTKAESDSVLPVRPPVKLGSVGGSLAKRRTSKRVKEIALKKMNDEGTSVSLPPKDPALVEKVPVVVNNLPRLSELVETDDEPVVSKYPPTGRKLYVKAETMSSCRDGLGTHSFLSENHDHGIDVIRYGVRDESEIIRIFIDEICMNAVPFKLIPAYGLYMVMRYILVLQGAPKFSQFVFRVARAIQKKVQEQSKNTSYLIFWMSNASEVLHVLKQDPDMVGVSGSCQVLLGEVLDEAYSLLIEGIRININSVFPGLVLPATPHLNSGKTNGRNILGKRGMFQKSKKRITSVAKANGVNAAGLASDSCEQSATIVDSLLNICSAMLVVLKDCLLNPLIIYQLFSQILLYLNTTTLNTLLTRQELCNCTTGLRLSFNLSKIKEWCLENGLKRATCYLIPITEAALVLQMSKCGDADADIVAASCTSLGSLQIDRLLTNFTSDLTNEAILDRSFIGRVVAMAAMTHGRSDVEAHSHTDALVDTSYMLPFSLPKDGYCLTVANNIPLIVKDYLHQALNGRDVAKFPPKPITQAPSIPRNASELEALLGPLPPGWETYKTPYGRRVFIDHVNETTTWVDPRITHSSTNNDGFLYLPLGWEEAFELSSGRKYYIDHFNGNTQWERPCFDHSNNTLANGRSTFNFSSVKTMTMEARLVTALLSHCSLEEYVPILLRERLDVTLLSSCTEEQLRSVGLPLGAIKRLTAGLLTFNEGAARTFITAEDARLREFVNVASPHSLGPPDYVPIPVNVISNDEPAYDTLEESIDYGDSIDSTTTAIVECNETASPKESLVIHLSTVSSLASISTTSTDAHEMPKLFNLNVDVSSEQDCATVNPPLIENSKINGTCMSSQFENSDCRQYDASITA